MPVRRASSSTVGSVIGHDRRKRKQKEGGNTHKKKREQGAEKVEVKSRAGDMRAEEVK